MSLFLFFSKIEVNGKDAHPIFIFLRSKLTGLMGSSIKWNFTKFLISRFGIPIKRYGPSTSPFEMEDDIKLELSKPFNPLQFSSPPSPPSDPEITL